MEIFEGNCIMNLVMKNPKGLEELLYPKNDDKTSSYYPMLIERVTQKDTSVDFKNSLVEMDMLCDDSDNDLAMGVDQISILHSSLEQEEKNSAKILLKYIMK